jgi:hypothetical protein
MLNNIQEGKAAMTCNWMLQTAQSKNLSSPTSLYILMAVCQMMTS